MNGFPTRAAISSCSDPAAASRFLILREAEHWAKMKRRTPDPVRLTTTDMARAVFVATLTRGLARDEATTAPCRPWTWVCPHR